eukprot:1760466-Rhodomonas_salina.7
MMREGVSCVSHWNQHKLCQSRTSHGIRAGTSQFRTADSTLTSAFPVPVPDKVWNCGSSFDYAQNRTLHGSRVGIPATAADSPGDTGTAILCRREE